MIPLAVVQSDAAPSGYNVAITASQYDLNLKTAFDVAYPSASLISGDVINFTGTGTDFTTSAIVGGSPTSLTRGTWPAGVLVKVNNLIVLGHGGNARSASVDGGDAVNCSTGPLEFNNCFIAAGGGAGISAYYGVGFGEYWAEGGGGAGYPPGYGNVNGTTQLGGVTFAGGGNGGDLGQPGSTVAYGPVDHTSPAGVAGRAIVGASNATLNSCTVIGAQV